MRNLSAYNAIEENILTETLRKLVASISEFRTRDFNKEKSSWTFDCFKLVRQLLKYFRLGNSNYHTLRNNFFFRV